MRPRKFFSGDDKPRPEAATDAGPAEAKKRIAENKRTHDKTLDLGGCRLETVPPEIAELVLARVFVPAQ